MPRSLLIAGAWGSSDERRFVVLESHCRDCETELGVGERPVLLRGFVITDALVASAVVDPDLGGTAAMLSEVTPRRARNAQQALPQFPS